MAVQRLSNSGRSGFSYKSLIAGITPLPSVPTIGAATAVDYQSVNVAFTAPGAYAGSTYTATSSPGGLIGTSATSPILVSGLSELTEYTFTVTATNATGTSGASAASSPVTTPSGDTGVMFPIQMVSVGAAGAADVTFSSIPSTYKHLQIRCITKNSSSIDGSYNMRARLNSDSSSNYSVHIFDGNGSSVSPTGVSASIDHMYIGHAVSSFTGWSLANAFAVTIIDILDYADTNKKTTTRLLNGFDINGSGKIQLISNLWNNTAAVTSISIFPQIGDWAQYSSFALYGIKGA